MKFGIREVANVTFRTLSSIVIGGQTFGIGEPVLYFDSLKASTLAGNANTVFAMGGRGNNKLLGWDGDKEITFTIEDALISQESFAILSGADLVSYDGSATKAKLHKREILQLDSSEEVTVSQIILEDNADFPVFMYLSNADEEILDLIIDPVINVDGVTVEFTTVTVPSLAEDDWVIVDYYYESLKVVKSLVVKNDSFGGYYKVEGDSLWRREKDGVDLAAYLTIPRAKIRTNFEFSMTPDGDPSTFTFELDAFPTSISGVGTNVLFTMDIEED